MSAIETKTVGELAAEDPAAAHAIEKLGIDYCCGGGSTLEDACRAAGLSVKQVTDSIESVKAAHTAAPDRDWRTAPLADLVGHIRNTHHQYTRAELARLAPLFDKVCGLTRKTTPSWRTYGTHLALSPRNCPHT